MADLAPIPALAGAPSARFGAGTPGAVLSVGPDLPLAQAIAGRGGDVDALLRKAGIAAEAVWTLGPGQRLVEGIEAASLAPRVPGLGVIAQTGSRGRLALRGPQAAALLARGVGADLHAAAFAAGVSAPMLFGRIGILLRRDAAEAWTILVPRSYALALWEEMVEAGRSLGLEAQGA